MLERPAIWAGPWGYSNIQSAEEKEAATAAAGAATKHGGTIHYLILLSSSGKTQDGAGWHTSVHVRVRMCVCISDVTVRQVYVTHTYYQYTKLN